MVVKVANAHICYKLDRVRAFYFDFDEAPSADSPSVFDEDMLSNWPISPACFRRSSILLSKEFRLDSNAAAVCSPRSISLKACQ